MSKGGGGPRVDPTKQILRRSKRLYLDGKRTDAGFFKEWWDALVEETAGETEGKLLMIGLLRIAAEKIWHEVTEGEDADDPDEPELPFTIDGEKVKSELRFEDATTPGGFRTVLREHATVAQLFGQAELRATKAAEAGASAKRTLKQANEALRRAGGRANELLVNVKD